MKGGEASGESVHTILKFSREEGSNKYLPEARKLSGYAYIMAISTCPLSIIHHRM
jgi:hypothetical protein